MKTVATIMILLGMLALSGAFSNRGPHFEPRQFENTLMTFILQDARTLDQLLSSNENEGDLDAAIIESVTDTVHRMTRTRESLAALASDPIKRPHQFGIAIFLIWGGAMLLREANWRHGLHILHGKPNGPRNQAAHAER